MGEVEGCNWFPGRIHLHLAVMVGKKAEDQCYVKNTREVFLEVEIIGRIGYHRSILQKSTYLNAEEGRAE